MRVATSEVNLVPRRGDRWLIWSGAILAAVVALLGLLALGADAAPSKTVTLVTSSDASSAASDAVELENIDFVTAATAVANAGDTITLPTTLRGFPSVSVTDVVVGSEVGATTIAFTGHASEIFGQTLPTPIDVAIIAVWDDASDDGARVVVSGQFVDATLGDVIGLHDGSAAAELPMPAGALTVATEPDATIPQPGEDLLDPTTFPANAQDFFRQIDGAQLRDELPLRGLINFQTAVDLGGIPAISETLGIPAGQLVLIDGSAAVSLENFPAVGGDLPNGLALRAALPGVELPNAVNDALGLSGDPIGASIEVAVSDSGTPSDDTDDEMRVGITAEATLGDPLPDVDLALSAEVRRSGTDTIVSLSAEIGEWDDVFGAIWLDLDRLGLAATVTSGDTGPPTVNVALDGAATIAGKGVAVAVEGTIADPPNASVSVELFDPVELGEIFTAFDIDPAGTVPAHVLRSTIGPATITLDVDGSGPSVDVALLADMAFYAHDEADNPIAATGLIEFSIGAEPSFALAVRPSGPLNLSDIIVDPNPDFELVSADTAVVFSFSTVALEADSMGDLSDVQESMWGPVFDDPDAAVSIPAGFNVIGTIELPHELSSLVGDTLGLRDRVGFRGTLPIDLANDELSFELSASFDSDRTPEWLAGGGLSFSVAGNPSGISVEIEGNVSVRFRSGLPTDVADDLAAIGLDVFRDVPVAEGFDCPGAAQSLLTTTVDGEEYRCFDQLNFTASASVSVGVSGVKADLALVLDATNPTGETGWQPFGLQWFTLNRTALTVSLSVKPTDVPPAPKIAIGVSGDVRIGDKDLLVAGKISVQPLPAPPFAKVDLEGFRFATDAGFEIDDFFEMQHSIAELGAMVAGDDPDAVAGPIRANDLGIPNIGLRNIDVSFSTKGDATLCIPQGLFISGDVYVDPTGDPGVRGPKCEPDGTPIAPPAGSTCAENFDKGCVAGGRIAVDASGFAAVLDVVGFDLGPVHFEGAKLDLLIGSDAQQLILRGGVTVDAIGAGHLDVSFQSDTGSTVVEFAGRLDVGPEGAPFFSGLADGRVAFDRTAFENSGIELRVVLDASNLSIEQLGEEFEAEASAAVDSATTAIVSILDAIQNARADFLADPSGFVTAELERLGVTLPPEIQALLEEIAKRVAEDVETTEAAILNGEFGGIPQVGQPKQLLCVVPTPFEIDDRCYVAPFEGVPTHGVSKQPGCPISAPQEYGGKCYLFIPQTGSPVGGADKVPTCAALTPFLHSDGKCYTVVPGGPAPDGFPVGGEPNSGPACFAPNLIEVGGLCYLSPPLPTDGFAKSTVCVFPNIVEVGGRCYSVPPNLTGIEVPPGGADKQSVCVAPNLFELGGRCYTTPSVPAVGVDQQISCPIYAPTLNGNKCWVVPPGAIAPNGAPEFGTATTGTACALPTPEMGVDGRCYKLLQAKTNGDPAFGADKVPLCPTLTIDFGGRCYTTPPTGIPAGVDGAAKSYTCTFGLFESTIDGDCYLIPPINLPGLCDVFGLDPNCTFDDVVDHVIEPALLEAAGFTKEYFGAVTDLLAEIERAFKLECAEFELVLDGSTQSVDVSVTMTINGNPKTFSLGWDLSKPLDENLSSLLDGLLGADGSSCTPVTFETLAAAAFETDGGAMLHAVSAAPDAVEAAEGSETTVSPLDNDGRTDSAVITDVTVPSGSGVGTRIGDDGRRIIFTAPRGLAPGERRTFTFTYTTTNASGQSSTGTGEVTVVGVDEPPVATDDTATLDLRVTDRIDIAVLDNDSDVEGAVTLVTTSADGSTGCPTVVDDVVTFTAQGCDGASGYTDLAAGAIRVETISYSIVDSAGATSVGTVELTVIGGNDAPTIDSARITPVTAATAEAVTVQGRVSDPDTGDQVAVTVTWGDGAVDVVSVEESGTFRVSHRYLTPGLWSVDVEAADLVGDTDTAALRLVVSAPTARSVVADVDGDGFDADVDCRDLDAAINPGATEVPYDGIDNDCVNGDLIDVDGDGYTALSSLGGTPDCNDSDRTINPGVAESPYDGIDNDCDGAIDDNNGPRPGVSISPAPAQPTPTNGDTVSFVVTFDQPVTGFDAGDVAVSGTTADVDVDAVSATTYGVTVQITGADGVITVALADGAAQNGFGQDSLAAASSAVVVDRIPIAVAFGRAAGQAASTDEAPIEFTVTLGEPVAGFGLEDLVMTGSAGVERVEISGSGTDFVVTVVRVTTSGDVTIDLAPGALVDAASNSPVVTGAGSTVTFTDTAAPDIVVPSAVKVVAEVGATSAVVEFQVSASDPVNERSPSIGEALLKANSGVSLDVTCTPTSGSTFDFGTTTVTCSARDAAGNTTTVDFDVTVERDVAPIIAPGRDQTVTISGSGAAPVSYEVPATTAAAVGSVTFACDPASGTSLAPGTYDVTCVATDDAGAQSTTSFTVRVESRPAGELPKTGGNSSAPLELGALFLAAGVALALAGRRRFASRLARRNTR